MKVLFLNLPYKFNISRASRWPEKTKSGTLYYPYWLSYCVGVCENKGIDVELIDCITRKFDLNDTLNVISQYNPDFIMCETTTLHVLMIIIQLIQLKINFQKLLLYVVELIQQSYLRKY